MPKSKPEELAMAAQRADAHAPKLPPQPGDAFHIGVCRACGRYGQLAADTRTCAVASPKGLVGHDHFRRTRACARIAKRRGQSIAQRRAA